MAISEKRYNQMLSYWNGNKEEVDRIIEAWGEEQVERGYDVFDFDGTGLLEIDKIDDVGAFESEEEAVKQAIKDGVRIIPVKELPENFDRRYLGWIDTPENRKNIEEYVKAGEN
jgi:hypothetical protein